MIWWVVLCWSFLVWLAAIFCHELGHLLILTIINQRSPEIRFGFKDNGKPYIKTGELKDYINVRGKNYSIAALTGIYLGLLPIASMSSHFPVASSILLVVYFYGCRGDIYKAHLSWGGEC